MRHADHSFGGFTDGSGIETPYKWIHRDFPEVITNVYFYTLTCAVGADTSGGVDQLANVEEWCALNGKNIEDMFLHVKGTADFDRSPATRKTYEEGPFGTRYAWNWTNPDAAKAQVYHMRQWAIRQGFDLTDFDGIFNDEFSLQPFHRSANNRRSRETSKYPTTDQGDNSFDDQIIADQYTFVDNLYSELEAIGLNNSLANGSSDWVRQDYQRYGNTRAGGYHLEYALALTKNGPLFWSYIDALLKNENLDGTPMNQPYKPRFNLPTPYMTDNPDGFPGLTQPDTYQRSAVFQLANYYMLIRDASDGFLQVADMPEEDYPDPNAALGWWKGYQANVGLPLAPRVEYATGVDGQGQDYKVFGREFANAYVLCRPRIKAANPNTTDPYFDATSAVDVPLPPGDWFLLHMDGNLVPISGTVPLMQYDAAILIKNTGDASWQLPAGEYQPAVKQPEIIYPRPDANSESWEMHRLAPTGREWRIPIAVLFGAWPFRYRIDDESAAKGISIGALVSDPDYGILSWKNPAIGTHQITVYVDTQDFGREPRNIVDLAPVTFTLEVVDREDTTKFVWVNPVSGEDTNDGSYSSPVKTIEHVFHSGLHGSKQCHLFGGEHRTDGPDPYKVNSTTPRVLVGHKEDPAVVAWTERTFQPDNERCFFGGFKAIDAGFAATVPGARYFFVRANLNAQPTVNYPTWFEIYFENMGVGFDVNSGFGNASSIVFADGGVSPHLDIVIHSCSDVGRQKIESDGGIDGNSGILSVMFRCERIVVENCLLDGDSAQGFDFKDTVVDATFRNNVVLSPNYRGFLVACQDPDPPSGDIEVCWNKFDTKIEWNSQNEPSYGVGWFYRNSHRGNFELRNGEAVGAGPVYHWNNAVEGAISSVSNLELVNDGCIAASGVLDDDLNLIGEYRDNFLGTHGAELGQAVSVPRPDADWMLPEGHYAKSLPALGYPDAAMDVWYPRPDNETNIWARHRRQHPGIPYRVPVCVAYGAAPVYFELEKGPPGMTIGNFLPWDEAKGVFDWENPGDYGIVTWDNPTATGMPASGWLVRVKVTDQEGTVITREWRLKVQAAGIIFIDPDHPNSGYHASRGLTPVADGTIDNPFRETADWYLGDPEDTTFSGYHVIYRQSAAPHVHVGQTTDASRDPNLWMKGQNKPLVFYGYPGETVTWDGTNDVTWGLGFGADGFTSAPDMFFGNIVFDGFVNKNNYKYISTFTDCSTRKDKLGTDFNRDESLIEPTDGGNRMTFFDCTIRNLLFDNISIADNGGFMFGWSTGNRGRRYYMVQSHILCENCYYTNPTDVPSTAHWIIFSPSCLKYWMTQFCRVKDSNLLDFSGMKTTATDVVYQYNREYENNEKARVNPKVERSLSYDSDLIGGPMDFRFFKVMNESTSTSAVALFLGSPDNDYDPAIDFYPAIVQRASLARPVNNRYVYTSFNTPQYIYTTVSASQDTVKRPNYYLARESWLQNFPEPTLHEYTIDLDGNPFDADMNLQGTFRDQHLGTAGAEISR